MQDDSQDERPLRDRRPEDTAMWIDQQIRAAIERGEFDDLPYAGKPLPERLTSQNDPDWWLKGLIEREQVTGVLPEALQLRTDAVRLPQELDRLAREADVREAVEGFNRRILEARRQLAGGPPVVTPLRDVEQDVLAWRERRRTRALQPALEDPGSPPRRRWFRRRRA
ncbi:DUF1992 domain-containing protein [Aeromicrobium alkaliterrae]|uniref:DnaJ homologue subfamily C member 28 conserved domain-containing protein n=1 Tax=Aeromicrobium alkaliterrae TaxID=302168 RepID=A0ABN2JK51_9ACTN